MIKINLLPKSIGQSSLSQITAGILTVFLLLVVVGLLGYYHTVMVPRTDDMETKANAAVELKTKVQGIQAEAAAQTDLIAPIKEKITFVNDVVKYNSKYPELFEKVARWTYDQVVYSSMSTSGGTLTMNARAQSLEDLGRYLLNMYRATDLFTSVSISNVPSYPGRSSVPNNGRGPIVQTPLDFTVTCQLKETFNPPTPPSGGGGGASAAASTSAMGPMGAMGGGAGPGMKGMSGGGMPGMPGASGGAMPGMPGMSGPGMKGMPGGAAGGPPMPGAAGGMPGMGGPGMKGMPGAKAN